MIRLILNIATFGNKLILIIGDYVTNFFPILAITGSQIIATFHSFKFSKCFCSNQWKERPIQIQFKKV